MPVEVQGREMDVERRDRDRGFRAEVHWSARKDDGELGEFYIESWVSPYLDDDEPSPDSRRDLTNDVCRRVIEGILEEKAHDDAIFRRANFREITNVRYVRPVGGTGFETGEVTD